MIRTPWQASRVPGPRSGRLAAAALLAGLAAGCADPEPDPMGPSGSDEVQLTASGFRAFAQGEGEFQLWISFASAREGAPRGAASVSAGRFLVREGGAVVGTDYQPTGFAIDRGDPGVPVAGDGGVRWDLATAAFVTIEAADDPDPGTPGPALLGGAFQNGTAELGPGFPDAIGAGFSGISGSFRLATPSTSATTDETGGVWFTGPGGATPSLSLPALTADWVYQGWVSNGFAGVASLGRFTAVSGADTDGSGPLQGTPAVDGPGYAFPGSDFPFGEAGVDLGQGSVFLTVEPAGNEDGPGPFFLELMGAPVGAAAPGTAVPMNAGSPFPTLTVSVPAGN